MVKELFVAFGRYNRKANSIIYSSLEGMSVEQLGHPIKAFYPTIVDTAFHVVRSDLKWLSRLSSFRESAIPKEAAAAYMRGGELEAGLVIGSLGAFAELRRRIDAEIIELIAAIPQEAFAREFEIEFGPGRIRRPLWELLSQWFNHQTHHRGQVSIQLDELGIENDFSGLLDKIG
jgi:uncharacterized damage-inducible protein DinB